MTARTRMPLVAGNWKMHGSKARVKALLTDILPEISSLKKIEIAFCPPFVYLQEVQDLLQQFSEQKFSEKQFSEKQFSEKQNIGVQNPSFQNVSRDAQSVSMGGQNVSMGAENVSMGAQNVYCKSEGAFTGEIAPDMLTDFGCKFVIVGHSERRELLKETDALVARKFVAAYDAGLIPILCVGENEAEREQGRTFEVLDRQLQAILSDNPGTLFKRAVIAYEPIWAIGTGVTATPEQAEEAHVFIRDLLAKKDPGTAENLRILYGGSVNEQTAQALFRQPNIDGGLIGGASLKPQAFIEICKAAEECFKRN